MSRLSFFGLAAALFTLVAALPADSIAGSLLHPGNGHVSKPATTAWEAWTTKPTPTPTSTRNPNCPTGTPYYIQDSADSNYAVILADPGTAADAFTVVLDATLTIDAV